MSFGLATFAFGCSGVPKDAPQEFHDAQAAIEKMDEADVDEIMPETAERADESFEESLDLLEEASEEGQDISQSAALTKAVESRELAAGATRISEKVRDWDSSSESFEQGLAAIDEIENPTLDVAVVDTKTPYAKLRGEEFVSTVAYFKTASADDVEYNNNAWDSISSVLEKDPNYRVVLTGFTDKRGSEAFNQELALKRAQTVANKLKNSGVNSEQIVVESGGMVTESGALDSLQLSRKVQAKVILR